MHIVQQNMLERNILPHFNRPIENQPSKRFHRYTKRYIKLGS